jgi:hypothetical protein
VKRFELAQALTQRFESGWEIRAFAGKGDHVFAFVGLGQRNAPVERDVKPAQIVFQARVVGTQIDDQYAVAPQGGMAVVVEEGAAQLFGLAVMVKAINQQNIVGLLFAADEFCAISTDDAEICAVPGDAETLTQSYDLGRQFDGGKVRIRQFVVAIFGNRTAAESNHGYPLRPRREEKKSHHGARVVEHQSQRVGFEHSTLDCRKSEMQRKFAVLFVQKRRVRQEGGERVGGHEQERVGLKYTLVVVAGLRQCFRLQGPWINIEREVMKKNGIILLGWLALAPSVFAENTSGLSEGLQVGDCVMFREGGVGLLLKTPTYWLRGTVTKASAERRLAERCPVIGKPQSAYSRNDWLRVAAAQPCVTHDAEVREVDVLRVGVSVDEWETPWSLQHGSVGWLFRGKFLDTDLHKGARIDMDAAWLVRCEVPSR